MPLSLRNVAYLNKGERNVNLSTHTEISYAEITLITCLNYSPTFYLVRDILAYTVKPSCTNPGPHYTEATTRCRVLPNIGEFSL